MKNISALIVLVFLLASCTERIELDLNDNQNRRIVVEGEITNEQIAHEIKLTWTADYFVNELPEPVTGAIVTISDGTNLYNLTEAGNSGRYYTDVNVQGSPLSEHTLTIDYEGELFTGKDIMYSVPEILMIATDETEAPEGEEPGEYDLLLWTQETPDEDNWYMWRVFINGVAENDTLSNIFFTSDQGSDGAFLEGIPVYELDAFPGDTIILEQYAVSEQANDTWLAMLFETEFRGGLFDSPPANVETNMSNGALGYFGAYTVSRDTTIVQ
ncbi:MAG: DUF4249 family protein [Bacteroidota bacterium]